MDLEAPPLPRVTAPVAPGAGLAGAERPQPQFGAKRSAHGGAGGRPPAKTVTLEWHVEEFSVTPRPELLGGKPVQILSDIGEKPGHTATALMCRCVYAPDLMVAVRLCVCAWQWARPRAASSRQSWGPVGAVRRTALSFGLIRRRGR